MSYTSYSITSSIKNSDRNNTDDILQKYQKGISVSSNTNVLSKIKMDKMKSTKNVSFKQVL